MKVCMRNSQHAHTQCIPVQTNEMREGERERKKESKADLYFHVRRKKRKE